MVYVKGYVLCAFDGREFELVTRCQMYLSAFCQKYRLNLQSVLKLAYISIIIPCQASSACCMVKILLEAS